MCNPAAAAGGQVYGGALSAYGQYQQGKLNSQYYNYLADRTKDQVEEVDKATRENLALNADDAARAVKQTRQESKEIGETQRAVMAANGVYSDSSTFHDIQDDTAMKQNEDEAAILHNADRVAWQTKRNAINQKANLYAEESSYRIQASNAKQAAKINAIGTLVGSAAGAGATMNRS